MDMQMAPRQGGTNLVVTSRPKELHDIVQTLAGQVKQKTAEMKALAVSDPNFLSRSIVMAVDLNEAAEQAVRDADRAMAREPQLDFQRPT